MARTTKTRVLKIVMAEEGSYTVQVPATYSVVECLSLSDEFLSVEGADGTELVVPTRLIHSAVLSEKSA